MITKETVGQPIHLVEPSDELLLRIATRAREEALYLRFRKRVVLAFVGFAVSLVGLILASMWFLGDSTETGFSEIISLLFSDSVYVIRNWREYGMSLLETLPVMNAIASLALLLCVIWCGMQTAVNLKGMRRAAQH